jgi:hypothetical protein
MRELSQEQNMMVEHPGIEADLKIRRSSDGVTTASL